MNEVIEHYNKLIDENNDPVHDSKPLKDYMDKWDGERFIESMKLNKNKWALEIGVGTGRLAIKVSPLCQLFWGIDISPKTISRAAENLSSYHNIQLICGDFMSHEFTDSFDVIYSSLTFMHIEDKLSAIKKIASLLKDEGIFVLSMDKNRDKFIDIGTRKIEVYPDDPVITRKFILEANLNLVDEFETEHAYVIVCQKASPV